jgi:hypothetical protein
LRGRRGTHNYTSAFAPPAVVEATAPFWQSMQYVAADLVIDGRLITAQHWADAGYAATVARALGLIDGTAATLLVERHRRSRPQAAASMMGTVTFR